MLRASHAFFQVAPVPDFSLGYASRRFFFPGRTSPSLTFLGCRHRWVFPRLRPSLTFPGSAWNDFLPARTSPSLTSFSDCGHGWLFPVFACRLFFFQITRVRCWLHFQVAPSLTFFKGRACRWFFPWLHMSLTFLPARMCPSLIFFPGSARRWFYPSCAGRWFYCEHESVCGFFFSV